MSPNSKRKNNISGLSNSILGGLAALDETRDVEDNEIKEISQEGKVEEEKNIKRSYMLKRYHIELVELMKMKTQSHDYSSVIREAIEYYYKKIERQQKGKK